MPLKRLLGLKRNIQVYDAWRAGMLDIWKRTLSHMDYVTSRQFTVSLHSVLLVVGSGGGSSQSPSSSSSSSGSSSRSSTRSSSRGRSSCRRRSSSSRNSSGAETVGGVGHWDKESRSSSRVSAAPASTNDRV